MAKLNKENQFSVNKEALSTVLENYEIKDFTIQVFESGIANTTVKIITKDKEYALRIYCLNTKTDSQIKREIAFQDYLRKVGIPIPVIYKDLAGHELSHVEVEGKNWQVILMEFIDGGTDDTCSDELLTELASIQSKMHKLGIEFAKTQENHDRVITEMHDTLWVTKEDIFVEEQFSEDVREYFKRAREMHVKINPELPHGYNHIDLDFDGNILVKDNKIVAILDFDDLTFSACVICLAYTLWHILFVTQDVEKLKFYINEYQKIRSLSELELKALPELILFRSYVMGILNLALWRDYESMHKIIKLENTIKNLSFSVN